MDEKSARDVIVLSLYFLPYEPGSESQDDTNFMYIMILRFDSYLKRLRQFPIESDRN